jgi:hypothetical protein
MRLRGSQVLAAGLVNGTLLQRGAFSLQGARLQGQVISAEVQLHQGFVVNRLKLQGPPVPRWAEGHLISFWDDRDNFLTSYHLLQVLGPDEVLLSEARRQVSWAGLSQVDPAAGTLTMGAGGAELSPGQAVQLFQDGRAYIFRIAESRGAALKVTALDGSAADLSAFSGQLAPGFGHVYETLAPGGRYEISSLCGLSVVGP